MGAERRQPLRPGAAWAFLAVALAATVVYGADPGGPAGLAVIGLLPLSSIGALLYGPARNRPARLRAWRFIQISLSLSFIGAIVRATIGVNVTGLLIANAIALACYPLLFAWLRQLLRARDPEVEADAVADGVLVGVAALMLAWVLLISPALTSEHTTLLLRIVENSFPVLDSVLLFLVLRMVFVAGRGVPALRLMVGALAALLFGDVAWALNSTYDIPFDLRLIEVPYLVIYGLIGAAALHPSMRRLTEPVHVVVRPLPRGRLLVLCFAVTAPALLVFLRTLATPVDRVVVAGGFALLAAIVRWRSLRALGQHAASEERLAEQATTDALTGLPNRARLIERLDALLAERTPVALLFCDLDGFKFVNDGWGHAVGDELLVAVGARLAEHCDVDLLARAGGDEFVLVRAGSDPAVQAAGVARGLLDALAAPFVLSVGEVFVTSSIGIATSADRPQVTPEELIRDADIAMYRAKSDGRNRWAVFDESLRLRISDRLRVEVELRRALARDELRVHYQPIVRIDDGELRAFEALVRWDHPERGLLPPADFLPLIADTDLIVEVGEHVLRRAARQVRAWEREGLDAPRRHVAVNVAARQLRNPGFVELVARILAEEDCPPDSLTLEMTEATMVADSKSAVGRLEALRALGVGLAVDDFGTGYSSLRYLKRFPVTAVKIDREFVDGLGRDPDDEAIVRAVLAMGHALGLEVVAEGVETPAQRDLLRSLGCDTAQGYLFGRPAPASVRSTSVSPSNVGTVSPGTPNRIA